MAHAARETYRLGVRPRPWPFAAVLLRPKERFVMVNLLAFKPNASEPFGGRTGREAYMAYAATVERVQGSMGSRLLWSGDLGEPRIGRNPPSFEMAGLLEYASPRAFLAFATSGRSDTEARAAGLDGQWLLACTTQVHAEAPDRDADGLALLELSGEAEPAWRTGWRDAIEAHGGRLLWSGRVDQHRPVRGDLTNAALGAVGTNGARQTACGDASWVASRGARSRQAGLARAVWARACVRMPRRPVTLWRAFATGAVRPGPPTVALEMAVRMRRSQVAFLPTAGLDRPVRTVVAALALLGLGTAGFAQLSPADLARAAAVEQLLTAHALTVWPGWGPQALLIRTHEHEVLIAHPAPPEGFAPVEGVEVAGRRVYASPEHLTPAPVATAWPVGDRWAVAVPALDLFQEVIDGALGEGVVVLDDPTYVRAVIHEAFHAFQMNTFGGPGGLPRADEAVDEREVLAALAQRGDLDDRLRLQGQALARALDAATDAEVRHAAQRFLELRASWRAVAPAGTRALERQVEWIEGLARYADTALLASVRADEAAGASGLEPLPGAEQVWAEFLGQLRDPAQIAGGLRDRYYVLGAAQGFVLDALMPDWRARALPGGEALEDLLAAAVVDTR